MTPKVGELVITHLPDRVGLYLGVQEPWGLRTLARFKGDGEAAARRFVDILVAGGFTHKDEREEDADGVLREKAREAGQHPGSGERLRGAEGADAPEGGPGPAGAPAEGRAA